ncbi:MAG: segregation/condensation protein A [Gammaproteobacteria bacterium]|nr:segregation/condensation protein A [Gammaproteobacteria bacterium]
MSGVAFQQWPQDLYIPPDALEVILESFEGPLDLLLYLIRKQNIDILDIPVAEITRQYMEYVELMRAVKLDLAAEYLVMAATLAEIKSRMLLPRQEEDEDEEDPRAALVRRLQEYERFRQAAQDIDALPRLERELYVVCAVFEDTSEEQKPPEAALPDLVAAFRRVVEEAERSRHWQINREGLSVRERMSRILERLQQSDFVRFEELFSPEEGRMGLVVTFIAILELYKDALLVVIQNEPFATIHVRAAA